MKKTLLAFALFMSVLVTGYAQVIITEIMYNPPESGTDSLEYIELHNFHNLPTNISGWTFTPLSSIEHTFPAGTIMPPGGYIVLAKNGSAFQSVFGFTPAVWTAGALSNSGESIELRDAAGTLKDAVFYTNAVPWPEAGAGMGPSIVLCDFAADNSLPGNWQAASTGTGVIINGLEVFGNPGAASNCSSVNQLSATDDFAIAPTGQAAFLNVQGNDVIINAITTFIITTPPTQGSATVSGSGIVYQSNPGYCGPDQFVYQICDATDCDEATVDINVRCYPQRSIGIMTGENPDTGVADSLNVSCELQGTVYGVNLRPLNTNVPALLFTIIDNNGDGIAVSSLNGNFGYTVKEKDRVTVRGIIGQFNGQTEIRLDTVIKVSENNPLLAPKDVTSLSEATESKLVKLTYLRLVDPAEWTTGVGNSGFNARAVAFNGGPDTFLIRIDRDVETYNAPPPCTAFSVIGIGGQFDPPPAPFNSGYQILPRYNDDILCEVGTNEADFSTQVSLSPNPVSDLLRIEMNADFDRVTLLRATGGEVKTYHSPGNLQKVDVSLLPAGVYFVRFEKDRKIWTARFVKQ